MLESLDKLEIMTKTEKKALCYELLLERDKINAALRKVQGSIKEDTNGNS